LDDHALPLGRLRMRRRGSAGGHNGLQDSVDRLGSSDFCRLRLGIDPPIGDSASYVLSSFAPVERTSVEEMIETAVDAVESWIDNGPEATMNRFNVKADES
jgi:PTH1 family peptidyl-tRNA hydrolase